MYYSFQLGKSVDNFKTVFYAKIALEYLLWYVLENGYFYMYIVEN